MRVMSYLHLTRFLRMMLDRKDRMSMAVGLEVRVPFCDHRLVEYVYNTPWPMKTYDGHEKSLLRGATKELLPQSVIERRKSPYPVIQDWRYAEALQRSAKDPAGRRRPRFPDRQQGLAGRDRDRRPREPDPGRPQRPGALPGHRDLAGRLPARDPDVDGRLEAGRVQLDLGRSNRAEAACRDTAGLRRAAEGRAGEGAALTDLGVKLRALGRSGVRMTGGPGRVVVPRVMQLPYRVALRRSEGRTAPQLRQ
ncbi:hypothetical protein GCM10020254_80000 [Streptomyces goshikiensis]